MPRPLQLLFLITDIGFIAYWGVSALMVGGLVAIPGDVLFKDYHDPNIMAWNWSFMPLDILASLTGLIAVMRAKNGGAWQSLARPSLTLTFCAGFMAISFWIFQGSFDLSWWLPNLFLMAWPIAFVRRV
jgi:hypothetical protein